MNSVVSSMKHFQIPSCVNPNKQQLLCDITTFMSVNQQTEKICDRCSFNDDLGN